MALIQKLAHFDIRVVLQQKFSLCYVITGVIQMMLPMLSSECTCKALLSSEYMVDSRKYDTSDFAVVQDMIRPSIYSDDSKLLHAMVYKVLERQHR